MPTLLAQLIAKREGFGITGDLPTRQNNPGDLRHAPGEAHPADAPNSVGSFDTPAEGWAALERQLELYAQRGMTVGQAIACYAPPTENDSAEYLQFICDGLGCTPETTMTTALAITNEGPPCANATATLS